MSIQEGSKIDTNWNMFKDTNLKNKVKCISYYHNKEYEQVKWKVLLTSTKSFKQGINTNHFS